jgi:two-component system response regulator AtoC
MCKILVVDDDEDTRSNMADLFGETGYRVDTAGSGDIALRKARQQTYDIGLLDVRMPDMDGLKLCRRLKQILPNIVPLIITGYPYDQLVEEALAAGSRHVLLKPIDIAKLFVLVERAALSSDLDVPTKIFAPFRLATPNASVETIL